MRARVGECLGTSRWFTVDQSMIDRFADLTGDRQYIHIDPVRAAASPFGGTVAHGFLTISMLAAMSYDAIPLPEGTETSVNYGFDRLRMVSPVRAGSRVRGHFTLAGIDDIRPGELGFSWDATVEIEGQDKPALVARWLHRFYLKDVT
ncbi:MaoC family dehydratase [Rhodobacteraceae bacterium ASV31]|nr:MaoC family dehydratase [Anianabacter salinae]